MARFVLPFDFSGRGHYAAPMQKILVLYDSMSGNTAQMAHLVAEGAASIVDVDVRLRHVDEASADDVVWCDGLAVGSPPHKGLIYRKKKRIWE